MQPFEYPLRIQDTYDALPTTVESCKNLMDELMFIYCQIANHDEERVEKLLIQSAHIKYRYIILLEDHSELSESFVLHYENSLPLMIWKHSFRDAYLRDCDDVCEFPFFDNCNEHSAIEGTVDTQFESCEELQISEPAFQIATITTEVVECGVPQTSEVIVEESTIISLHDNHDDEDIWFDAIDYTNEVISTREAIEEFSQDHEMRHWIPDRRRFDSSTACCESARTSDENGWIGPCAKSSLCYDGFVFVPGSFDPNVGSLISNMTGWCTVRSPDGIVVETERPVRRDRLKPLSYLALKADVRWLLTRT